MHSPAKVVIMRFGLVAGAALLAAKQLFLARMLTLRAGYTPLPMFVLGA